MTRSEFRTYFKKDPEDRFANFDRKGNARIGMPYPTLADASVLVVYAQVVDMEIGFHEAITDSEPLNVLLEGWRKSLKRIAIQDFRFKPPDKIVVLDEVTDAFCKLKSLYELSLTQVEVSETFLGYIAQLKKLRNITISSTGLTRASIEILATSSSIQDVMVIGCSGVISDDEQILIDSGRRAQNIRINRGFG